jgi:protein-S-isoprenylcysteine O-methyltransferase Ste14
VILATHTPSLTLSQTVLSTLVRGRGSDRIQLSPLFLFGTLLTGLGGYIRYRCYRALGRLFTFEMSIRSDHKLITDGPYSIVRHPGYTGILFTITGIICWHASSVSIVLLLFCMVKLTKLGTNRVHGRGSVEHWKRQ